MIDIEISAIPKTQNIPMIINLTLGNTIISTYVVDKNPDPRAEKLLSALQSDNPTIKATLDALLVQIDLDQHDRR